MRSPARRITVTLENGIQRIDRYHDAVQMQKDGIKALRAAKYEKKLQTGMFDDMDQEEGWGYLMAKILHLPRSEKFIQMMEARKRLIHRKLKAKLRRKMAEAARAKRMSKSVKSGSGLQTAEEGNK